jgi:dienelactone hydrolase
MSKPEWCSTWFRRGLFAFCMLASALSGEAEAQVARMEVIAFESLTLTDQEFLTGREDGKPVTIAGELRLPRAGNERFPLVILLHGSGGISGYVTDWEQEFLSMGVATFVIDSFTSRGIVNTNNDQSQLGRLAQTEDAYRALALLAKHPRIDSSRVMLMGFSRGGQSALYASMMRFQKAHLLSSEARFAAYVAFYPPCNNSYRDDDDISAQPVRVFQGTADDYVPIEACRAYMQRLKAKGKDVQFIEYQGAGHLFDGRAFKTPMTLPQAQTTLKCQWQEGENGQLYNAATRQPFSYNDPCVQRGGTFAYNEKAATEARKAVAEFVAATLKPVHSP